MTADGELSLRLVLFDIDGTLLHAGGVGRDAKRAAMLEVFGTAGTIESHRFGGKTDWSSLVELLANSDYSPDDIALHLPRFAQVMGKHIAAMIGDYDVRPYPGAMEAVTALQLREDVLMGIVTGNLHTTAPIKLQAAGFDPDWFAIGAYGDEALNRDDLPKKALARAVLYTGRRIEPQQVVVVGDTLADVQSARALGAKAVAVLTGFGDPAALRAARPDILLPDLRGLLPWIDP